MKRLNGWQRLGVIPSVISLRLDLARAARRMGRVRSLSGEVVNILEIK